MTAPPGLVGAAVCFWAWQAGVWWAGVPLALALEAHRFVDRRFELPPERFDAVADMGALLWFAAALYLYFTGDRISAFMSAVLWIPAFYAPLLAAQVFSAGGKVDASAVFLLLRRQRQAGKSTRAFDLSYPFLALCLFCAGAANKRDPGFYIGAAAVTLWALWTVRPKRSSAAGWAAAAALAAIAGYGGHLGLRVLQMTLEKRAGEFIFSTARVGSDPFRSLTNIGKIGAIQQSGKIALRVRTPDGNKPPRLLREAGYNFYHDRNWVAKGLDFLPVPSAAGEDAWLLSDARGERRIVVSRRLENGEGLLALPAGSVRVNGLEALKLRRSGSGAVSAVGAPFEAEYGVVFDERASLDSKPGPADLDLPAAELPIVRRAIGAIGLERLTPSKRVDALARHFTGFTYTTYQAIDGSGPKPLEDFLFKTRAGHCEYFATATVLLLRAAGIPARYQVGYSVAEYDAWDQSYVARERHAHAWASAWVDGRWQDVDTTPPTWLETEDGRASWFEPLRDKLAWAGRRIARWTAQPKVRAGLAGAAFASLLAFVGWKLRGPLVVARRAVESLARADGTRPGLDSELYGIERGLAAVGLGRRTWEAWPAWLDRVGEKLPGRRAGELRALVELHARYRFDPKGLEPGERAELARCASRFEA